MNKVSKLLLASHGTLGAQAAEQAAFKMCTHNPQITHLYVVPEFWKNMLGDDWLNNGSTRKQFEDYLEAELAKEADQHIERVHNDLQNLGIHTTHKIVIGDPQQCLLNICKETIFDLVILGSPRPKKMSGLRSRMVTKSIARKLIIPFLQVPHPNA